MEKLVTPYEEFTQQDKGWGGGGFKFRTTEIKVRRVRIENQDEAQIEICITEHKGERLYSHHGSIVLSPDDIARLITVLSK